MLPPPTEDTACTAPAAMERVTITSGVFNLKTHSFKDILFEDADS